MATKKKTAARRTTDKGGRPPAMDEKMKEMALRLAKMGFYKNVISDLLGISSRTMRREEKSDAEFGRAMDHSQSETLIFCVGKLFQNVNNGNQRAIEYFLNNRYSKLFQNRQQIFDADQDLEINVTLKKINGED